MGGKEKKVLSITSVPKFQSVSLDQTPLSGGSHSEMPTARDPQGVGQDQETSLTPSGKVAGLHAIRSHSDSLCHGKLAFFHYLERVETMRCFWELKYEEQQGGFHQVCDPVVQTCAVQWSTSDRYMM